MVYPILSISWQVSIDSTATNNDLAREVAIFFTESQMRSPSSFLVVSSCEAKSVSSTSLSLIKRFLTVHTFTAESSIRFTKAK